MPAAYYANIWETDMSDIDQAIRQALSAEDRVFLERLEQDPPLHRQIGDMFRGRQRWLNVAGWIAAFVLFAVSCLCAWRFVSASDLREMLLWGGATGLAVVGLASVKIWMWMELHRNSLSREIKRLELLIVSTRAVSGSK